MIKATAKRHLINLLGWRTERKLVVLESDDWGMIRMASREAYQYFLNRGYAVDECHYNRNDALESNADLEYLLETLDGIRDKHGNPAVLTANNIVGNPDFEKIQANGFRSYHYESFPESLKRYPEHDRVMGLYRQGIERGLIKPQFHGREHVNVNRWLAALRNGQPEVVEAFQQNMFTVHRGGPSSARGEFVDTLGYGFDAADKVESVETGIQEGVQEFVKIWGFSPASFIAPCYIWNREIEKVLHRAGVEYLQGNWVQLCPDEHRPGFKKIRHYQGRKNEYGQRYLIRNVQFEPAQHPQLGWVDRALSQIKAAFLWRKPAVICTHRVNYIGYLRPENRDQNLQRLKQLLLAIKKNWPEVEFCSSDQLGRLITKEHALVC